jgi:hypothetical protein
MGRRGIPVLVLVLGVVRMERTKRKKGRKGRTKRRRRKVLRRITHRNRSLIRYRRLPPLLLRMGVGTAGV